MRAFSQFYLKWIFLLGLGILPFVFWPTAYVPYEIPRVWFFIGWSELLVWASLIYFWKVRQPLKMTRLGWWLVIFLGAAVASSLLGVNWPRSINGNYYRADGLVTLIHLLVFSWLMSRIWKPKWQLNFLIIIVISTCGLLVWGLTHRQDLIHQSLGLSFGQPNYLAGYLLVVWPFMYYAWRRTKLRLIHQLLGWSLPLMIIALIATGSIAATGLAMIWLISVWVWGERGKWRTMMLFWLITSVLLATVYGVWQYHLFQDNFTPENRVRIYTKTFLGALKRPLTGYGWANVDTAFRAVPYPVAFRDDLNLDKAHGIFLELFTTTGILGLGIYGGIIFLTVKKGTELVKSANQQNYLWRLSLLSSLILYLLQAQTNVISIGEEVIFWLIVGIVGAETI